MIMSGTVGQIAQGDLNKLNAKPLEPSALGMLTKRLHAQVVSAQSIESEVEAIARRLGGSVPTGVGEASRDDTNTQIQVPRIDEMNGLVDLLSQTLCRTESELQRLRRMVD